MARDYKDIPQVKLEKIHHAQLKVIEDREKKGQTGGLTIKFKNPLQFEKDLRTILDEIFSSADKKYSNQPEELLGMRYFIAVLYALPLEKLKAQELQVQKELKTRKELYRQRIDAGNIDNIIKKGG